MPVVVQRIPETPVIIARLTGEVSPRSMEELVALSAEAAKGIEGVLFRIVDTTQASVDFAQLWGALRAASRDKAESRFKPIFVGRALGAHGGCLFAAEVPGYPGFFDRCRCYHLHSYPASGAHRLN